MPKEIRSNIDQKPRPKMRSRQAVEEEDETIPSTTNNPAFNLVTGEASVSQQQNKSDDKYNNSSSSNNNNSNCSWR